MDDRGRGGVPDRHPDFAVGKPVHGDFLQGEVQPTRQPPPIDDAGWQALDRNPGHGVTMPRFSTAYPVSLLAPAAARSYSG